MGGKKAITPGEEGSSIQNHLLGQNPKSHSEKEEKDSPEKK